MGSGQIGAVHGIHVLFGAYGRGMDAGLSKAMLVYGQTGTGLASNTKGN